MASPLRFALPIVLALALPLSWIFFLRHVGKNVPSEADAKECHQIVEKLKQRHAFRVKKPDGSEPAVSCRPHRGFSEVLVYGDYSAQEQDGICQAARKVRSEFATKPVQVSFYPHDRAEAELMRRETIP